MHLLLAPGILEQLTANAKQAFPQEACGLLVGRGTVERFIAIRNVSPSPSRFDMDPTELIHVFRELRNSGEQLLAIYHSHPHGPAEPSQADVERANYPEAAYLIISLADPEHPRAAAFRVVDGAVLPVELHAIV
jgi:proteasome lid subunit RPN8/RPN11